MHLILIVLLITAAINLFIGILVYFTNPRRVQNRQFLVFSANISLWSFFIAIAAQSQHPFYADIFIRAASYTSTLIPVTFYLLCLAADQPQALLRHLLHRVRYLFIASQAVGLACFSPLYLQDVSVAVPPSHVTVALYGPFFVVFNLYIVTAFGLVIFIFGRLLRSAVGIKRTELQYIVVGVGVSLIFAFTTSILIPQVTGSSQWQPFSPFAVIVMNAIIAYGIATRRILDVGYFLRLATAYILLICYLGGLYAVCWFVLDTLLPPDLLGLPVPHLLTTVIVALSMLPAEGRMQQFAHRLYINVQTVDKERTLREANHILHSVTRLDALLRQFGELISHAFGAEHVALLFREGTDFVQVYSSVPEERGRKPICLNSEEELVKRLASRDEVLVADLFARKQLTMKGQSVLQRMKSMSMTVAVGVHYKNRLEGILLLGPRLSGRIYGATEQDLLKLLSNQLGVAIENAKLYTEVQDGRIYNNILLDSMVSGVIAANKDGEITVFNREAQRITGWVAPEPVGSHIDLLPTPLREALLSTLHTRQPLRDQEYLLPGANGRMSVLAGTTAFWGHQGNLLGALVVFSDTTRVKELEFQVRRHDRLASIGTLSAGMAHEIKNPLVSIKTFTELLPERYEDPDFRDQFSALVGVEVQRIDRIVNQLLRFARPAKAELEPMALHDALDHSLSLVHQQLVKGDIQLTKCYDAPTDRILGDADLLQQAFLNFIMNAIDAMDGGGQLRVGTHVEEIHPEKADPWGEETSVKSHIHLTIEDTGGGIPEHHLAQVFDPFFTTKSSGTGLGLAVAHGILDEHSATVKVHNQPGKGAVFHLVFPLATTEATV